MRIRIKTRGIKGEYRKVFSHFDERLFDRLLPPKWVAEVEKYEGNKLGDRVIINFKKPVKGQLKVEILSKDITSKQAFFMDEGLNMPFGIKYWRHFHRVFAKGDESVIVDDIHFSFNNRLKDMIAYPIIKFIFKRRCKVYKAYFESIVPYFLKFDLICLNIHYCF